MGNNLNFNDINKVFERIQKIVYPNVKTMWKNISTEEILINKYLTAVDEEGPNKYQLLFMPFLVSTEEYLKKYKNNCIIFYNTPNSNDGLILFIHQISPILHVHSKFFCWVENNEVYDYLTCAIFHKNNSIEAVNFINDNFNLAKTGNTEERSTPGFTFK